MRSENVHLKYKIYRVIYLNVVIEGVYACCRKKKNEERKKKKRKL
jgi:hypothetical protein